MRIGSLSLVLVVLLAGVALRAAATSRADATTATPMVTVTLSRTEISAADGSCKRDDRNIATLDKTVLPWMAMHTPAVHLTGSVETGRTLDTSEWCPHYGETTAASWAEMQSFQANYGMRFISHSATYATNWSALTPASRFSETCGSRDAISAHGLLGADGQFDWPNNVVDPTVQQAYVEPCFYFNRIYAGRGLNTLAWSLANHHEVRTMQVFGGSCNTTGLACSSANPYAYVLPSTIINTIKSLVPGQHYSLQTYLLVQGTNPPYTKNPTRWDCTSTNPAYHWANDIERYCWSDFRKILTFLQNDPNVTVTDPEGVAIAWGMSPPTM